MDENTTILCTDVLNIIDDIAEEYYVYYRLNEMADENMYNTALTVLTVLANRIESLAEETDGG